MYQISKYSGYMIRNDFKNNGKLQKIKENIDDGFDLKKKHSQLSLESIDSETDIIDNSTFEQIECKNLFQIKPFHQSATNRTALMLLDPDDQTNISKAKSDSHLYFCLEDDIYAKVCEKCPMEKNGDDDCDSGLIMEPEAEAFPKRNTNSRMSLYKKMKNIYQTNMKTTNIELIRRKFTYSNKLSRKLPNRPFSMKETMEKTLDNFKSLNIHRTSEPNINSTKRFNSKLCKD